MMLLPQLQSRNQSSDAQSGSLVSKQREVLSQLKKQEQLLEEQFLSQIKKLRATAAESRQHLESTSSKLKDSEARCEELQESLETLVEDNQLLKDALHQLETNYQTQTADLEVLK